MFLGLFDFCRNGNFSFVDRNRAGSQFGASAGRGAGRSRAAAAASGQDIGRSPVNIVCRSCVNIAPFQPPPEREIVGFDKGRRPRPPTAASRRL
jgi:hypothetical protein